MLVTMVIFLFVLLTMPVVFLLLVISHMLQDRQGWLRTMARGVAITFAWGLFSFGVYFAIIIIMNNIIGLGLPDQSSSGSPLGLIMLGALNLFHLVVGAVLALWMYRSALRLPDNSSTAAIAGNSDLK